jgi:hypothetical protein
MISKVKDLIRKNKANKQCKHLLFTLNILFFPTENEKLGSKKLRKIFPKDNLSFKLLLS